MVRIAEAAQHATCRPATEKREESQCVVQPFIGRPIPRNNARIRFGI